MDASPKKPIDRPIVAISALTVAFGLYFTLVGLGTVPLPGKINGPMWLAVAAGIVFLLGGISVGLRGYLGMDDKQTELPPDTPHWAKLVWWGNSVVILAAMASIGTWVAFGPGEREFSMSGVISGPVGSGIGRIVFGIGAIITWFAVIAFARVGYRKVFGKTD